MEKFISWSDSEGQNMDLIKQYFDQHPEMLEGKKELLEINQKYSINLIEWRAKHGDFKTAIELLYRDILKEIESKKHDEDYNSFLMQENAPKLLISQFKRQAHLFPNQSKDIDFAVSTMEALQSIIEAELSRLQLENSKSSANGGGNKKSDENRILAYNNEVDNALEKIELILNDINSLLFENSTSDQWEQILNLETPTNPIICKSNIDINCLTAFCEKLCNVGIFRTQYKSFLASITAFTGDKLIPITKGRQFTDALQYGNEKGTTIDKELEEIFNKFKEKI